MDKLLTISHRELTRLEVMRRLEEKRLPQKEAGYMLEISNRQVKCLWRPYRMKGTQGLVSARRGKPIIALPGITTQILGVYHGLGILPIFLLIVILAVIPIHSRRRHR